jgi:hypothetical protein
MTVRFFIGPFDPSLWQKGNPQPVPETDLEVDPCSFRDQLLQRWPETERNPSLDQCFFLKSGEKQGIEVYLQSNRQYVSFTWTGYFFHEFILWYRSFIPEKYPLYLFNSSSWNSLALSNFTKLDDIIEFTGINPVLPDQ